MTTQCKLDNPRVKPKVLAVLFAIVVGLHQGLRYYYSASKTPYNTPSPDFNRIPFVREHAMSLRKPINALAGNVFRHLKKESDAVEEEGLLLSPYGLAHALSMLLPGCRQGSDAQQHLLQSIFGNGAWSIEEASEAMQGLAEVLATKSSSKDVVLDEANSAWVSPRIVLKKSYEDALKSYAGADIQKLTSAGVVNSWVAKATHDKITEIIDEGTARQASLVLINALYFKGLWAKPFDKVNTEPQPFYLMNGMEIDSPLMYLKSTKGREVQGSKFMVTIDDKDKVPCVAVKMAYLGMEFSAIFAMPFGSLKDGSSRLTLKESGVEYQNAVDACEQFILSHDNGEIRWKGAGDGGYSSITVHLPRFEITTEKSLSAALSKEGGLPSIFRPGDFDKIADVNDLFVSDVRQKVYVKVDEEGTEAAAVTSIVMLRAMIRESTETLDARFDRPFHFSIIHNESGVVLFSGTINKPETS